MGQAENLGSAGASNTPAVNTDKNNVKACVDWVSCGFKFACDVQKLFHFLGIEDLSTLEIIEGARYEFAGYEKTFLLGKIEIMHYEKEGENYWFLNMSGQGCRQYEISSKYSFKDLFILLSNIDAVFTRLDIALDDFSNIFTVNQFRNAVHKGQCVTRLRTWGDHQRGLIATGNKNITMNNFYLGSTTSRYFLNVYDKKLERIARGFNEKELPETWVRTEVRFSYEMADLFIMHIIENKECIGYHIKSFLNDKIVFLKPSALNEDKNRSRLAKEKKNHARFWRRFLNKAGKLHLSVYEPDKTLDDSKEWLEHQVSTTLAMFHQYDPEHYWDLITQLTAEGLRKMKAKHERKVLNQIYLDKMTKKNNKKIDLLEQAD